MEVRPGFHTLSRLVPKLSLGTTEHADGPDKARTLADHLKESEAISAPSASLTSHIILLNGHLNISVQGDVPRHSDATVDVLAVAGTQDDHFVIFDVENDTIIAHPESIGAQFRICQSLGKLKGSICVRSRAIFTRSFVLSPSFRMSLAALVV